MPDIVVKEKNKKMIGNKVKKRFIFGRYPRFAKIVPTCKKIRENLSFLFSLLQKVIKGLVLIYGSKKSDTYYYGWMGPWKN